MNNIVTVMLDKERHFKFTINSLIIIEELTGVSIQDIANNTDMKMIRALVYAGLLWEDKKLTLEYVGDLINFENLSDVMEKVSKAMEGLK